MAGHAKPLSDTQLDGVMAASAEIDLRAILLATFGSLLLAGSASAQITTDCKELLDGGWRCTSSDGHVTERRATRDGRRTTSTDPARWRTSDGHGRGVTPPDSVVRNSPAMRSAVWGRVSDPWERPAPPPPVKGGWRTPEGHAQQRSAVVR